MTACTWPHCGCNSTQGNHCRAPSVRADLAPALAVPEVAAQTFALLKIKSLHERTDNIHRGKEWQATARAIDDALAVLRGEGRG